MLKEHKEKLHGMKSAFPNSRKAAIGTTIADGILAEAENLEAEAEKLGDAEARLTAKIAIFGHASLALATLGGAHMNGIAIEDAAGKPEKKPNAG